MTYLCIFGECTKELLTYLDLTGFKENKPIITDEASEYRAVLTSLKGYKALEGNGDVVVAYKLKDGSTFAILTPFGTGEYFTFCDLATYKVLKEYFNSDEVLAVHIDGDIDKYENQLTEFSKSEYDKVADIRLSSNSTLKQNIKILEDYLGRKIKE